MKITKITLENFLCYSGKDNIIKFTDGINLVLGANGYGKSKLYDAFNWLFFDRITNQKGEPIGTVTLSSNLISKKTIEETTDGEIECKVILELETEKEGFQIERKYSIRKEDEKLFPSEKSDVKVFIKNELEYLPHELPVDSGFLDFVRDNIIPIDILPHIWFQGERGITKAVDTSSGKTLHQVINKISYIEMWQRYVDIADNANNRIKTIFDKEARKSSRKKKTREALYTKIEDLQTDLNKNSKELASRRKDLGSVNQKIDNISLNAEAQEKISNLKLEEEKLTNNFHKVKEELDALIDSADRNLFDSFWVINKTQHSANSYDKLYSDYIYEKQREINEAKENLPKIPRGNPTATHLNKMIIDRHCHVCDRPAPKGSDAYNHIEKLLPENYPSPKPDSREYIHDSEFKKMSQIQIGLLLNIDAFEQESEDLTTNYYKKEDKRVELKEKLENIKDKKSLVLTDAGLENLDSGVQIGKKYKNLSEQSSNLNNTIGRLENSILADNKEKEELEEKYQKSFAGEIDEKLTKQMKFFKSMLTATKHAKESQFLMLVKLLEEKTNQHYENINKESGAFYGEIKFHKNHTEGYTARIHDADDVDVTNNMNTSQILSMQLSILFAILSTNKEKGLNKKYPLIADAPNSSFDPEKRKFLLREMGRTFDQTIIMMFEYLEKDPDRQNRYKVNTKALKALKTEMKGSGIGVNIIHLDIPNNINPKKLQELSITQNHLKL